MKFKKLAYILLFPALLVGCDSLFDKGDVEKSYDGPDQVGLFPLQDSNNLGCNVQSTTIQLQLISSNGVAASDVPINFSAAGGSSARPTTDYSFGAASPVTIPAGGTTVDIPVNFVVTTMDLAATDATDIDSARAFGTYAGLADLGGSGTGAEFTVEVAPFGEVTGINSAINDPDSARISGTYTTVAATGGSGSGVTFDVVVPEYGEVSAVSTTDTVTTWTPGTYRNVPVTGGSGTEATFNVTIEDSVVTALTVNNTGFRYVVDEVLTISVADIGGTGTDLSITVDEVNSIVQPTVTIVDTGDRYIVEDDSDEMNVILGDTLVITAADLGGVGGDIRVAVTAVTQIAPPSVTVTTGGVGYACTDSFTVTDADLGGAGASSLEFDAAELTGSFEEQLGVDEVLLLLQIDGANVQVAANLDSTNVFMGR